jgi:hypothetical protein
MLVLQVICLQLQKQLVGDKAHKTLWPGGILYYDFSDEFHDQHKAIIEKAIFDLQRETCVRFVRRTTEPTYVLLRNTNRGYVKRNGNLERRRNVKSVLLVTGPPLCSSGRSSWLQIQRSGFSSPRYQIF